MTATGRSVRKAAMLASTTLAAVLLLTPAAAHLWYPSECCNDQDCFKVHKIDHQPDGSMIMHAGHFSVHVPKGFVHRPSQDNDAHVCVYRNVMGRYLPRCVFLPGSV